VLRLAAQDASREAKGPEKQLQEPTFTFSLVRPLTTERRATSSIGPAGVLAMACKHRIPAATREVLK